VREDQISIMLKLGMMVGKHQQKILECFAGAIIK
jgi:hypothetical protein